MQAFTFRWLFVLLLVLMALLALILHDWSQQAGEAKAVIPPPPQTLTYISPSQAKTSHQVNKIIQAKFTATSTAATTTTTTTTTTNETLPSERIARSSSLRALTKGSGATAEAAQECSIDVPPENVYFTFAESQIENMYDATRLNKLASNFIVGPIDLWIKKGREMYERFDGWQDIVDTAIVAKPFDTQTCHAVFGTGITLYDLWQNISPFTTRMEGTDCVVRASYYNAYVKSYYDKFLDSLTGCLESCPETGKYCPLVLSGYSQSGAIAVIAAIDLREYNPTIITFGSTQAILAEDDACTDFNAQNHYQIVSTTGRFYDGVAVQPNPYGARHRGHFLLLEDDATMFGYPGFNANNAMRFPVNYFAHLPWHYSHRIARMMERGCFPIPAVKWGEGHWCNYDDECASNNCQWLKCA